LKPEKDDLTGGNGGNGAGKNFARRWRGFNGEKFECRDGHNLKRGQGRGIMKTTCKSVTQEENEQNRKNGLRR
jgi:hypothetical protein